MRSPIPKTMRRRVRVSPVLWYLVWFAAVFWVGGSLPIWDDWFWVNDHVGFDRGTLWSLIAHLPEAGVGDPWHRHRGNLNRLIPVLLVGGGPLVYYLISRPRSVPAEAEDYADGAVGVRPGRPA